MSKPLRKPASKHHHTARARFQWSVWGAPMAIGAVSAVGLVSGLLGDDAWDVVSWIGLGLPVAVCLWFGLRRRAASTDR